MSNEQYLELDGALARRYEYENEHVIVADLGVSEDDVSIDLIGDTAIVVVDGPSGGVQHEIDLPNSDAEAFIKNGVVSIEVNK